MYRVLYCIVIFLVTPTCVVSSWAESGKQGVPVTTTALNRSTITVTEESMGWIEAKVNPMVAAEVSGQIERIFFDTGQVVKVDSSRNVMAAIVVSRAAITKALLIPSHCQTTPNNTAPGKIMIPLTRW